MIDGLARIAPILDLSGHRLTARRAHIRLLNNVDAGFIFLIDTTDGALYDECIGIAGDAHNGKFNALALGVTLRTPGILGIERDRLKRNEADGDGVEDTSLDEIVNLVGLLSSTLIRELNQRLDATINHTDVGAASNRLVMVMLVEDDGVLTVRREVDAIGVNDITSTIHITRADNHANLPLTNSLGDAGEIFIEHSKTP